MIPKTKGINPPESKMKYKPQQFYNMDNSPINSPTQVHHQNHPYEYHLLPYQMLHVKYYS